MGVPSAARLRGQLKDASGTVASGGRSQLLLAQNANRDYMFIQNLHATADLWVNFGVAAAATQGSIKIPAGAVLDYEGTFLPTDSVQVFSGTTGHPFTVKEG